MTHHLERFATWATSAATVNQDGQSLRDLYLAQVGVDTDLFDSIDGAIGDFLDHVRPEWPSTPPGHDSKTDRRGFPVAPAGKLDNWTAAAAGLPGRMTLEIEAFLVAKARRTSTLKSYRERCDAFGRSVAATWKVNSFFQVGPAQCTAYQSDALNRCALPAGHPSRLSVETVRTTRRHMEALFNWGVRSGECESNPWRSVPSIDHMRDALAATGLNIPEPPPRDATDDALRAMLAAPVDNSFEAVRNRTLLGIFVDFAPRRGQLVRMALEHVRLQPDRAFILVPADGKSRAAHLEACGADTRKWLIRYLRRREKIGLSIAAGPLFSDRRGRPLAPAHVTKVIGRMARRAGVKETVGPHRIRHAEVRRAKEQGQPDRDIRDRHGWSDGRMVDHYGRLYGGERLSRDADRGFSDELLTLPVQLSPRQPHKRPTRQR